MKLYNYPEYNISLIDLNVLLPGFEINLINLMFTLGINKNLNSRELKNIVLHSLLIDIIQVVTKLNSQIDNKLIMFYTLPLPVDDLITFLQSDPVDVEQLINNALTSINTKFPISIINFSKHIDLLNSGELLDMLHIIKNKTTDIKFKKVKQFLQKNGLKKLNKDLTIQKMLKLLNK